MHDDYAAKGGVEGGYEVPKMPEGVPQGGCKTRRYVTELFLCLVFFNLFVFALKLESWDDYITAKTGVSFVGLEGQEKDKVVVIGDGVDAVKLTRELRKKVGYAEIISLAEQK